MTHFEHHTNRLVDRQVEKWTQSLRDAKKTPQKSEPRRIGPYVAISREVGAGGSEIARRVGEFLHWRVLDREIIDDLADTSTTSREVVEFFDEKQLHWISEWLSSWIAGRRFNSATYVHRLHTLIELAARQGNAVIVGRGAPFILPREAGIRVSIIAPFEFRVEQVMLQHRLSAAVARRYVKETDQQRADFIKSHFHRDPRDAHSYDLVINLGNLTQSDAEHLIVSAVQAKLAG